MSRNPSDDKKTDDSQGQAILTLTPTLLATRTSWDVGKVIVIT